MSSQYPNPLHQLLRPQQHSETRPVNTSISHGTPQASSYWPPQAEVQSARPASASVQSAAQTIAAGTQHIARPPQHSGVNFSQARPVTSDSAQGTSTPGSASPFRPAMPGTATQLRPTLPTATSQPTTLMPAPNSRPRPSTPSGGPGGQQASRPPAAGTSKGADNAAAQKKAKKRKADSSTSPAPQRTAPVQAVRMPESDLLTELQELDDKILKAIADQKQEVRFTLRPAEFVNKRLRIFIQSEHLKRPPALSTPHRPTVSWTLKIWGKLVDGEGVEALQKPVAKQAGEKPMSSYVQRLRIVFEGDLQEDSGPKEVVWEKQKHEEDHCDLFSIKRESSGEVKANLEFELDSRPPFWNLSEQLARVTNLKQASRTEVLSALWSYIRLHKLQDLNGNVQCDTHLQALFEEPSFEMSSLSGRIDKHLTEPPAYKVDYIIRPGGPNLGEQVCYELDIRTPLNPNNQQTGTSIDKLGQDLETDRLQMRVNSLVEAAKERARRRDFLVGFTASPIDFINGLIASQARDLRAAQKPGSEVLAMRRSQFFGGKWVEDAVLRYLHRRLAASA